MPNRATIEQIFRIWFEDTFMKQVNPDILKMHMDDIEKRLLKKNERKR